MNIGKWIGLFTFFVSLYILWQIREVLLLVFAAVVIANALSILVQRFHQSGMKRVFAVVLALLLLFGVLVGFFWLIVPPFADQFQQLMELVPQGIRRLSIWFEVLQARISPQLMEYIPSIDQLIQQLQPLVNQLLGGGLTIFSTSLGFLVRLLLVLVLTLMLLAQPAAYRQSFIRLFPSFYRRRVDQILLQCQVGLRGWMVGILFNMLVIGLMSFVGLVILRVPLALAQASLAGILTFIPNIGPVLSVIPPMAIALLETPWKALAVLILYIVIQQIESNFLTPYVMAHQVSLLPAVTLIAQVFFATFFGFLGLLLALPLAVVGQVWLREVIIKDILDQWHSHDKQLKEEVVLVSENLVVPKPSSPTKDATEECSIVYDKPSLDEADEKS
ncbi:MAG: AI-2E family transporter [Kastovskya adunca ATA6-11-RM4]|nr:AI-2E family transporter [Kastovskya adunca ATA6-11-RM4]